jgi:hypothetical protein
MCWLCDICCPAEKVRAIASKQPTLTGSWPTDEPAPPAMSVQAE